MNSTIIIAAALGLRHGADPDHLAAIDGLSRLRPHPANGLFFALGHGLLVTLFAVGVGRMLSNRLAFVGPWLLIGIGMITLWRLRRPASSEHATHGLLIAQPILLGVFMAAGFETASQFAALVMTNRLSPGLVGGAFTLGMCSIDGLDGLLASATQSLARTGSHVARSASRSLGIVVVIFSFVLSGTELLEIDLDPYALPIGLILFAIVIAIRIKARAKPVQLSSREACDTDFPPGPEYTWVPRQLRPETYSA